MKPMNKIIIIIIKYKFLNLHTNTYNGLMVLYIHNTNKRPYNPIKDKNFFYKIIKKFSLTIIGLIKWKVSFQLKQTRKKAHKLKITY